MEIHAAKVNFFKRVGELMKQACRSDIYYTYICNIK